MDHENHKTVHIATQMDIIKVLSLGLPTPSLDIATGELRNDSLQNIMRILAHQKFPAHKQDLLECARTRNAEAEVIEFLTQLPEQLYVELSTVVLMAQDKRVKST